MKRLKIILHSRCLYVILIIILLIYCLIFTKIIKYVSKYNLGDTELIGQIIDYNIDGNKLDLIVKGKEKVKATYYINTEEEKEYISKTLVLGSKINLKGSFKEPYNNTIPNTFNYKKYLYNKKIYKTFSIDSYELSNETSLLYKLKDWTIKRIESNAEISPYLKTFLLGDKRELNVDDYDNFQMNGVSHLFAISGMHISLFSMILLFILKKLKLKENKCLIITFSFLFLYAFLTGFPASICRALIFMLFITLNKKFELGLSSMRCLLLGVAVIIFVNPFFIYDLGFQYSVITVMGLLSSSHLIKGNYLNKLFKTSLIAFLFSLPLTIYNFYEINLLSPFINLLFVPLVSYIIYPIVLLGFIFPFLTNIISLLLEILLFINSFASNIDIFLITVPKINFYWIMLCYLLLVLFIKTGRNTFIIVFGLAILLFKVKPKIDSNFYVYFLDVGQGDSSVIISPYQEEVIMVDTGGEVSFSSEEEWEVRKRTYNKSDNIITFFKSVGITKLNTLIISHGDYDHMGEAINSVNNFKVEKVIFNCGPYNDLETELIKVLDEKKISYYSCINELNIDNKKLYFLNNRLYDNENDSSNVIYAELNNYKFLFMGDAGVDVEEDILEKYNLKDIDVLKVGHHGSKTSSGKEFIEKINPKYSIISVGKNNRYGHPNEEVLKNLEDTQIYRTDYDGSIMFKINKNKLEIETCAP